MSVEEIKQLFQAELGTQDNKVEYLKNKNKSSSLHSILATFEEKKYISDYFITKEFTSVSNEDWVLKNLLVSMKTFEFTKTYEEFMDIAEKVRNDNPHNKWMVDKIKSLHEDNTEDEHMEMFFYGNLDTWFFYQEGTDFLRHAKNVKIDIHIKGLELVSKERQKEVFSIVPEFDPTIPNEYLNAATAFPDEIRKFGKMPYTVVKDKVFLKVKDYNCVLTNIPYQWYSLNPRIEENTLIYNIDTNTLQVSEIDIDYSTPLINTIREKGLWTPFLIRVNDGVINRFSSNGYMLFAALYYKLPYVPAIICSQQSSSSYDKTIKAKSNPDKEGIDLINLACYPYIQWSNE